MSTIMDIDPAQVNIATLVDQIITGQLRTGQTLPKLDSTRGEEFRSMLIAEADLLKSQGMESDALRIRMIEGRVAESLDYDERQKGVLGHCSTLNKKSSAVVQAEESKTGEHRGMSAFTSIDSLDFNELDRALARMPTAAFQTPKTSPSSPGKSRSKSQTQKTSQPLKFDMSPASTAFFDGSPNVFSKTTKPQPKLTLSKSSVAKEAQSGSATDGLEKENARGGNETKRASSAPICTTSCTETEVMAPNSLLSPRPALPAKLITYFVKISMRDGGDIVEERATSGPTKCGISDGGYRLIGRFVPMAPHSTIEQMLNMVPISSDSLIATSDGNHNESTDRLQSEKLNSEPSMCQVKACHVRSEVKTPLTMKLTSISRTRAFFKVPTLSIRNLWIIIVSAWAMYSIWYQSNTILGGAGAGIKLLKEGGLWLLDKMFGFFGGLVQCYSDWREEESGIISSAVFDG